MKRTQNILIVGIAGLFAMLLIAANAAKNPISGPPESSSPEVSLTRSIGIDGPTPTPCPPGWSGGAVFPAAAVVRAVGNYFPSNGHFYSMGGRSADTAGNDFTHPFEFDPSSNTWTTKSATYPDNMVNNMACGVLTVGGTPQIYCVGGSAAGGTTSTGRVFSYDPITDTIMSLAGDDWPGAGATVLPGGFAVVANKLYILGGFDIPVGSTNATWAFDPTAAVGAKWTQKANYPVTKSYVPAAAIGGIIYTGGGSDILGTTVTDSAQSFKYDTATDTYTAIASIPRATGETRAVTMGSQMWVLGGGRTAPNPSNEVDIYDPGTNTWSTGTPFGVARRNFPADSDGSAHIFLVGGYDAAALNNTMEVFGPNICSTPTPTPGPTETPTPSATVTPTPGGSVTPTPTPGGSVTPTPGGSATPTPSGITHAQNLSTRLRVETGNGAGIGGFIVTGTDPKVVLIRGIGPSLGQFGVPNPLADPKLELSGSGGFTTVTNNNWRDTQEQEIIDTGIPPTNDFESAILATLNPGLYTAVLSGNDGGTGAALVEIYDLSPNADSKLANISTRAFVNTGNDVVIGGFILGGGSAAGSNHHPWNRTEPRRLRTLAGTGGSTIGVARQQRRHSSSEQQLAG